MEVEGPTRLAARGAEPTRDVGPSPAHDAELAALRAGDEAAFVRLVERHHATMVRVARALVPSRAVAEEVVQDTWCVVIEQLHRFEGRSALRTWIFRILCNRARSVGAKERRSVPFSALARAEAAAPEPAVDPERFAPGDAPTPGHWVDPPRPFPPGPEAAALSAEVIAVIERAIRSLRPGQRSVITLRDVAGWRSEEVCEALEISMVNQRVLLHRARSAVRRALEVHYAAA